MVLEIRSLMPRDRQKDLPMAEEGRLEHGGALGGPGRIGSLLGSDRTKTRIAIEEFFA